MSPLAISLRFLQTQPDQRLVELARAGHERAFEALVRRYRGPLLAYCRRLASRGASPEDILQQGLLQAWRALNGGAEVRDARAWLYRIVHNVAISALRSSGELPEGVVPEAGPGVEQLVEQRMAAREALAGLAALPELQRRVMVSTALDGASHEEIAAALGLSSGSVRGLIYRARSTLRAAAAAVIPTPVIEWALGDAGATSAGLAGAGSAGLGALILKGGTIIALGAVAGTTAVVVGDRSHHARHAHPPAVVSADDRELGSARALQAGPGQGALPTAAAIGEALPEAGRSAGGTGHDDSSSGGSRGGSGRDGSGNGPGSQRTTSGDGGSPGGGGSSTGGDGSGGGGDHGATTASTGSDGGGGHQTTTTSGGIDGGSSSGSSDGGGSSGSLDGGSSGGGSSDGGQLSGSDGSPTTTTTANTTTTATTTTSDGGH